MNIQVYDNNQPFGNDHFMLIVSGVYNAIDNTTIRELARKDGDEIEIGQSGDTVEFLFWDENARDAAAERISAVIRTREFIENMDERETVEVFGGLWAAIAGWTLMQSAIDRDNESIRRFCGQENF